MAFRFSLEQVLNYRERLEQQARIELARVEGERLREQRRADGFRVMIDEQTEAMARLTPQQRDERNAYLSVRIQNRYWTSLNFSFP